MDKNIIKKYLNANFISESDVPGISVTNKNRKESGKFNKEAIKDIDIIDLDLNVKYRNKAIPPDSWDREKHSYNDKSWKTQSKRKHQWK